ncbi:S9 family peptidase [Pseudomonas citronellolis]|uniref:S9 family peptidase n=1 Tax=Pseudomonas citronellolis TaxID=53408 RepID=UPI0023E35E98|nr:S9 family peptidase [Pseudomonas citronellolis]MDF3936452.1 S9 family peptidase [Pseudomonas citronellolis]
MRRAHGDWPSAWSAERAVAAGRDFAELHAAHGGLLWLEFDPRSARCRLYLWRNGDARELTPPGASARSRVYEYGGGACCATADGVAWVEEGDQQVRWLRFGEPPRALTERPQCRYGDLHYVAAWHALLAVEESREGDAVLHRIVRLDADGARQVLVEGADFYAAPTASADAARIAWVEWNRPQQPWTATRLCLSENGARRCLAGEGGAQSIQQPRFDAHGQLHWLSDRSGWWRPEAEHARSQGFAAADHAPAPWQLGGRSYLPLPAGDSLLSRFEDGRGLLILRRADGRERRLAADFSRFRALAADAERFYCIAGAEERLPAVLAIDRATGAVQVLSGGERPLDEAELSRPQSFSYPVAGNECGHGFLYPPRNARCRGDAGRRPPLVVFLHGGPTSACYPVFDARIQFWTQRGFAVADLNHRGSANFGRAYRERLRGEWGRVEVQDIWAAVAQLAAEGAIDRQRVFVRGASAGGYSALCALAFVGGFRGGASLYGVSDPLALGRVTHKFEADYLDWLIGDPQRDARRYRARTPLLHAARIQAPVIFFQGELDAVVVPAQTEAMVDSLRQRGLAVEHHLYPGERHGFRQAANLAHALDAEWRFYRGLLGG